MSTCLPLTQDYGRLLEAIPHLDLRPPSYNLGPNPFLVMIPHAIRSGQRWLPARCPILQARQILKKKWRIGMCSGDLGW
jgi:hypothetical protein